MKIEIWCLSDSMRDVTGASAWIGDMPAVPRVGEHIEVHEGWGMATVRSVVYGAHDGSITVEIDPDYTGEYAAEAARKGGGEG